MDSLEIQVVKIRAELSTYKEAFKELNRNFVQISADRDRLAKIVESNQKMFDRMQTSLNNLMEHTKDAIEGVLKHSGLPDEVIASALSVFPPKVS